MSPALLAHLRAVERDTRRLHWLAWQGDSAIYPRDYFRPADPGCYRYR